MDLTEAVILKVKRTISETKLAIQVELNSGSYWFPKSQCRILNNKFYIPKWLAEEKQLKIREDIQHETTNNNNVA